MLSVTKVVLDFGGRASFEVNFCCFVCLFFFLEKNFKHFGLMTDFPLLFSIVLIQKFYSNLPTQCCSFENVACGMQLIKKTKRGEKSFAIEIENFRHGTDRGMVYSMNFINYLNDKILTLSSEA